MSDRESLKSTKDHLLAVKGQHQLYREALERASRQQPIVKYTNRHSLLLTAPNNIIFELFNTIIKATTSDHLLQFLTENMRDYLETSWPNKITQQVIKRLRREQAVDSRAGLTDIPLIKFAKKRPDSGPPKSPRSPSPNTSTSDKGPPLDSSRQTSRQAAINQIYDHVLWRINTDNVTQITSLLVKLIIDDGYKRGKLKAETYEDVAACFEDWRSGKLIKLYSFGDAPPNDQRLILANTSSGDLTKWVANYVDGSGKKQNPELIRTLSMLLRDRTKNCIFVTNDMDDAIRSLETGAIRCAFVVDRLKVCSQLQSMQGYKSSIEPLMSKGKLFLINSLECVEFAPDPTSESCC